MWGYIFQSFPTGCLFFILFHTFSHFTPPPSSSLTLQSGKDPYAPTKRIQFQTVFGIYVHTMTRISLDDLLSDIPRKIGLDLSRSQYDETKYSPSSMAMLGMATLYYYNILGGRSTRACGCHNQARARGPYGVERWGQEDWHIRGFATTKV